jgi:hypothetical protein
MTLLKSERAMSEPLPYDPKDIYWVFREASRFDAEVMRKVGQPLGAAMAEQVDRMWQDAIDKAKKPEVR